MDAIHYYIRNEGQIVKKAVYIAIGIDLNGHKDVLGMWVGEKFKIASFISREIPVNMYYATSDEQSALAALDEFEENWGKKYPSLYRSAYEPPENPCSRRMTAC